jgi:hypothetical protein
MENTCVNKHILYVLPANFLLLLTGIANFFTHYFFNTGYVKRKSLDLDVLHVPAYVGVTKVRRPGRGHSTLLGVPSVPIRHPGSMYQFDLTSYTYTVYCFNYFFLYVLILNHQVTITRIFIE